MTAKFIYLILFFAAYNTCPVYASERINIERCKGLSNFKSSAYIDVAISLQSMPNERAIKALKSWADSGRYEMEVIILCRMLFDARAGEVFRRPNLGAPVFCGSREVEVSSSSPLFKMFNKEPICIVDGVPFLIVKTYVIVGSDQEKASSYLAYCIKNTNWNTFKFKRAAEKSLKSVFENLIETYFKESSLNAADLAFLHRQIAN